MTKIEATPQQDGHHGLSGANVLSLAGQIDPSQLETILRMADGKTIRLDTSFLVQTHSKSELLDHSEEGDIEPGDGIVVPLVEERLEVGKRTKATGTVRLNKSTQTYTRALDETLAVRTFEVERIVLNQRVDVAPPVRQEGNVTVYSLVEEQLVLTKQLVLTEEVRVVQLDMERRDTQMVTLLKDHLTVEREILK